MRPAIRSIGILAVLAGFSGAPAGVPANVYLSDPSDGHVAQVQLERLDGDGTKLVGRYVRVTSERLSADGEPIEGVNGTADFRYEPIADSLADCTWHIEDCSRFDAVNVYYHVDRFAHEYWTKRLGVEIDFQAAAVTHYPGEGASANLPPGTIKFGLGTTMMKNAALDPDIIHHEYTHLVTTSLGFDVGTDSPVETRAINEGIAHYFAASFSNDPRIGEWVVTCPPRRHCAGPPNDTEMATLATDPAVWNWNDGRPSDQLKYGVCTRYYPLDGKCKIGYHNFSDAYTWGMIWGSTLWDVRESIGVAVADRLVLESIRSEGAPDLLFAGAVDALLNADVRLYDGAHQKQLADAFRARGFRVAPKTAAESPYTIEEMDIRLISPNPASSTVRFQINAPATGHVHVAVYDELGRRMAVLYDGVSPSGTKAVNWMPQIAASGRYFAVLTDGTFRKSVAFVLVQ